MREKFDDSAFSSNNFGNGLRENVIKFQLDHGVVKTIAVEIDENDTAHLSAYAADGNVLSASEFSLKGKRGELQQIILTKKDGIPVLDFIYETGELLCDLSSLYEVLDHKQDVLSAGKFISLNNNEVAVTLSKVSELENDAGYLTEVHWGQVQERPELNAEVVPGAEFVALTNIKFNEKYYYIDLSSVVPYSGAAGDIDLNNKSISNVNNITFNGELASTDPAAAINHIVTTHTAQNIDAQKTFTAGIKSIAPVENDDLTTKQYVDEADILKLNKDNFGWAIADHIYNRTYTYDVGDMVYYDGYVYKCKTAVTTHEDFDYNKWDKITLEAFIRTKQDILISGTNIKTIANKSLVGAGNINLTKADVGLTNVDNTADIDKPISTVVQAALDLKAEKVGLLPHFNLSNLETNVLDFITANNVAGKTIVLHIEGNQDDIIGIFVPVGSKYAFRLAWVSSNVIFEADTPVDLTNTTWNKIFDYRHSPFKKELEMTNNKVASLSASSTDTEYPSAKAVYDNLLLKAEKVGPLPEFLVKPTDSVLEFIEANEVNGKPLVLHLDIDVPGRYYYYQGCITHSSTKLAFVLKEESSSSRIYAGQIPSSNSNSITFADIISLSYSLMYENQNNKVDSIDSSSTNQQYPSAKATYDSIKAVQDAKQDNLVSGTNIKTVNNESILGSGNISITKSSIGLGNVTNDAQVKVADKGIANGVATLDTNAKIPLSQLPDLILGQMIDGGTVSGDGLAALTSNAQTKLGVSTATLQLVNTESGTGGWLNNQGIYYTVSSAGNFANLDLNVKDVLMSSAGGWQKIDNTDSVVSVCGKKGIVTLVKSDVGLENVDNTADLAKPISTATQAALNTKQATLVNTVNIKSVEGQSLLGSGNITLANDFVTLTTGQIIRGAKDFKVGNDVSNINIHSAATTFSKPAEFNELIYTNNGEFRFGDHVRFTDNTNDHNTILRINNGDIIANKTFTAKQAVNVDGLLYAGGGELRFGGNALNITDNTDNHNIILHINKDYINAEKIATFKHGANINVQPTEAQHAVRKDYVDYAISHINKQDTLVSGVNIKTVNGESILGAGNLSISNCPVVLFTGSVVDSYTAQSLNTLLNAGYNYVRLTGYSQYAPEHQRSWLVDLATLNRGGTVHLSSAVTGWNDPLNIYVWTGNGNISWNGGSNHQIYINLIEGIK